MEDKNRIKLVVDANVIFSAIISSGKAEELLFDKRLELFTPEFVLEELSYSMNMLGERTDRTYRDVERIAMIELSSVKVMPRNEFVQYLEAAKRISPDPNDVQYFALALKMGSSIWSSDKALRNQSVVKVYSTSELVQLLCFRGL